MARSERRGRRQALAPALLAVALGACASNRQPAAGGEDMASKQPTPTGAAQAERRWQVLDGEQLVMEVSSKPGPLISVAAPPPGLKAAMHPFLSASSRSAHHEHRLRQILDASSSLEDFLRRVQAAGLTVKELPPR